MIARLLLTVGARTGGRQTVEPDVLSRFEGEGGLEVPPADLVDVPLDNAIWRRPHHEAVQTEEKKSHTMKLILEPVRKKCEGVASL